MSLARHKWEEVPIELVYPDLGARPRPPKYCRSSTPRPAISRRCSMRCWIRRHGCARPPSGFLLTYAEDHYRAAAFHNVPLAYVSTLQEPIRPSAKMALGGIARGDPVAQIEDAAADEELFSDPTVRGALELAGFRTSSPSRYAWTERYWVRSRSTAKKRACFPITRSHG